MASLNRVILIGNLTRDPELRFTPNGTPVASFGIAVNRRWTNKQGERQEGVDFFNIVVWGKLAELCGDYINKGSPVAIDGRLQNRTWQTEDGAKRSVIEIVAENVQFLGKKTDREEQGDAPSYPVESTEPSDVLNDKTVLDEDIPY